MNNTYEESGSDSDGNLNKTDNDCAISSVQFAAGHVKDANGVEDDCISAGCLLEEHYSHRNAQWFQYAPFKQRCPIKAKTIVIIVRVVFVIARINCVFRFIFTDPTKLVVNIRFPVVKFKAEIRY